MQSIPLKISTKEGAELRIDTLQSFHFRQLTCVAAPLLFSLLLILTHTLCELPTSVRLLLSTSATSTMTQICKTLAF